MNGDRRTLDHSKDLSRSQNTSDGERKPLDMIKEQSQKNMPRLERTRSDLSEKQSQSKNSFDLLKNNLTRSSSLPKAYDQHQLLEYPAVLQKEKSSSLQRTTDGGKAISDIIEERINEYIKKYVKVCDQCQSELKIVQYQLKQFVTTQVPPFPRG